MDYSIYKISELPARVRADCLSPNEQATAARRGGHFALIRSLLKQEIARRLRIQDREVELQRGPHGKPSYPGIHFNISHSGDCLCMAFHHSDIGVDVERMKPRNFSRLANQFMAKPQLCQFHERDCPQQEFYACWCAAEALVKQSGDTIWHSQNYHFSYEDGRICVHSPDAPVIELFEPMPGYMGAVAFYP